MSHERQSDGGSRSRGHELINTPRWKKARYHEAAMRLAGLRYGVPCVANLQAAKALPAALAALKRGEMGVVKLQDLG